MHLIRRTAVALATLALTTLVSHAQQKPSLAELKTKAESSGFKSTSTYDDVVSFMKAVDAASPLVHYTTYGTTHEGRLMPMAVVGTKLKDATAASVKASGKLRVHIQANVHAGEVEGKEAALVLLREFALGQHADWLQSMTNASCPVGGSPLASANSQLQYLFINQQAQLSSPILSEYQSWTRTGTNGGQILIEANVVNNNSSGNTGNISACALVLTNQSNGDQLRLGCSHADVVCSPPPTCDSACTYTQGYYKNHESAVAAILAANPSTAFTAIIGGQVRLRLGNNYYTAAQLDAILETPVGGRGGANGLIQLAHQLITAELNFLKNGALCTPDSVEQAIAAANTMIGNLVVPPVGTGSLPTSQTSSLNNILDNFNNGNAGVDHCN
jgi:hypothetical protein